MKNNKNINALNTIYKTCEMGIIGINDVIDKTKKEEFRDFLDNQRGQYNKILKKAEELFSSFGMEEKELGPMAKINSKIMSEMKLVTNNSDQMVAKMMMEGTNQGVIKINKTKNENKELDKDVLVLADELLDVMENNLDKLKIYL